MNPERGFITNVLFGSGTMDPKQRAELDKLRALTDGAIAKVNQVRTTLPGSLEDGEAIASAIDALKVKFAALRDTMQNGFSAPADTRRAAGNKIVAENGVLNSGVAALLDDQVHRLRTRWRRLSPGKLRQHCLDAARRRRLQCQHAQEHGRRKAPGHRSRKAGSGALQRTHRADSWNAAGIAQESGDPRECQRSTCRDAVRLCRAVRGRAEIGTGRPDQRQIRARRRHLLQRIPDWPCGHHQGPRRLLCQRRAGPGSRALLGPFQLPGRARRIDRCRGSELRPDRGGLPSHPRSRHGADRPHVEACGR
jgi:hypothetical protein